MTKGKSKKVDSDPPQLVQPPKKKLKSSLHETAKAGSALVKPLNSLKKNLPINSPGSVSSSSQPRRTYRRKRSPSPDMTEAEAIRIYEAAYRNLRLTEPFTNPTSLQVKLARGHNEHECPFFDKMSVDLIIMILELVLISTEPVAITRDYKWPSILGTSHDARHIGNEIYYKKNTFAFTANTQEAIDLNALWLHELTANNNKRMLLLRKVQLCWLQSDPICTMMPLSPFATQFGRDWRITLTLPNDVKKRKRFSSKNPLVASFDNGVLETTDPPVEAGMLRDAAEVVRTTLLYQNANWFIYFSKTNLLELMKDVKERGMLLYLA